MVLADFDDAATSAITIGGACAIGVRGVLRLH